MGLSSFSRVAASATALRKSLSHDPVWRGRQLPWAFSDGDGICDISPRESLKMRVCCARRMRHSEARVQSMFWLTKQPYTAIKAINIAIARKRLLKLTLDMRRPALLVVASPHLHRFCISLDFSVFRIQM
jgi:hypothetical protein